MKLTNLLVLAASSISTPVIAETESANSKLDEFGAFLVAGDVENAKGLLSSGAQILSYLGGKFKNENLEVLVANFEGRSKIDKASNENITSFDVCQGLTSFILQIEVRNDEIFQVRYGVNGFAPPPVPYSMRKSVERCKPPVMIVSDF